MEIAFHTGMDDRVLYACRLLRKACARGARVMVDGSSLEMDLLDQALWTFDPQDFVPHLRWSEGVSVAKARRTPVWLVEEGVLPPPPRPPILLRFGERPVDASQGWERVIELVSLDDDVRRSARARWRDYEGRGLRVTHHPVASGAMEAP